MIHALVLDIESTTSPIASVHEVLYGYTRDRIRGWFRDNRSEDAHQILDAARHHAGRPGATEDETAELMRTWLDTDVKCEPLKTLQGMICGAGFANGDLHGEFFPDVASSLRRWKAAGRRVYVYSSGSERNQRDWFTHARSGRLDHLVDGHFDLQTAGNKRTPAAYHRITASIGVAAADTLFLSDSVAELDAATGAGWSVLGVARPGEPVRETPPHEWITTFDDVDVHIGPSATAR